MNTHTHKLANKIVTAELHRFRRIMIVEILELKKNNNNLFFQDKTQMYRRKKEEKKIEF